MSITHSHHIQTFNFPRLKNWVLGSIKRIQDWRKLRRKQRIDRLAFQQLLYLDDHLLRDTGYERTDLEEANNLPLDVDAAAAVKLIRDERRVLLRVRRKN